MLIPGAFVCRVSKVNHPDVNFGETYWRAAVGGLRSLLRVQATWGPFQQLLPIIDDEERAGVEAI